MKRKKARGGRAWRKRVSTLPRELKVGDRVRWTNRRRYRGVVIRVVRPGEELHLSASRIYGSRPEVSYLVEVRKDGRKLGRILWPRQHYLTLEED